jgi:type I restriction enzyme S subunit
MKPSGIDWIGDIPEHWLLMQYRHLFYNLDKLRMPITADQRSRNNPQYDYYGASGVIDIIDYYNVDD